MNEHELKQIWIEGEPVPVIDAEKLRSSLTKWSSKLHRKLRVDMWLQGVTAALTLVPVFFYPRLIFASLMAVALGIWYVCELRRLDMAGIYDAASDSVKKSLTAKMSAMRSYFYRTRIVLYVICPLILPAAFYGTGFFDTSSIPLTRWALWLLKNFAIYEVLVILGTELYFKITYSQSFLTLKTLVGQMEGESGTD